MAGCSRTALVGACLTLLAFTATPAQATFPGGADGKIAFQSNRDGNFEIYAMNPDGTAQTRLTNNPASDAHPRWSADGTKIAFQSNRDGNLEIYTMNANGTGQTRITNNDALDELPGWSPDGTKIVFDSDRDSSRGEIYTMNADGTNVTGLTFGSAFDSNASWSPDGTKIAWQSASGGGQYNIFTMNANGTNQVALTTNPGLDENPNWASDGKQLWFDSDDFPTASGDTDIFKRPADGIVAGNSINNATRLDYAPASEPLTVNNTALWTIRPSGADSEIYKFLNSGPDAVLTNNSFEDEYPDWQPIIKNHARPRGATPLYLPLVPAQKTCTGTPNQTRTAPPGTQACVPAQPESSYLTVGTPDANGAGANFIGSVRMQVRAVPPDGLVTVNMTDVRCAGNSGGCTNGALSDYSDDLRFEANFRITDKANAAGNTSGTAQQDLPLKFSVPCVPTAAANVGSTCSISTSVNTVLGGTTIAAGRRAISQLDGEIKLYDGGADGVSSTLGDNTLFAVGGLFYP